MEFEKQAIDSDRSSIRFSRASREAFAHALKIARQAKAELEMVPVERPNRDSELERFPGCVRYWRAEKFCR
jgi:hypothetical protein